MTSSNTCTNCGGRGWLPSEKDPHGIKECQCAVLRSIARAMDVAVRRAQIEDEHVVRFHELRANPHVLFACGRRDMLAMHKIYRVTHQIVDPSGVICVTDAQLARNYYADARDDDGGAEMSNLDMVRHPRLLIVELGVQRSPHKSAAPALLEAITTRLASTRSACWLFNVGGRFGSDATAFSDDLAFVIGSAFKAVDLRVLDDADVMVPFKRIVTPETSNAPATTARTLPAKGALRATTAGRCKMCGAGIAKGDEFIWADENKGRAHPACIHAKAS